MRKERKAFPPAQPCSGSPPRARCVIDRGCGAALGPGLDGPLSPLSALRRCSLWLPLHPGVASLSGVFRQSLSDISADVSGAWHFSP